MARLAGLWRYALLLAGAITLVVCFRLSASMAGDGPAGQFFSRFFDMNREANLPAWYSSCLWLIGSVLCYRAAQATRAMRELSKESFYWYSLTGGCVLLSLDETGSIHESIGAMLDALAGDPEGYAPVYRWVWAALVVVGIAFLFYLRFLLLLPRRFALGLMGAGAIFLLGSIGLETLGSLVEWGTLSGFPPGLNWPRTIALEEFTEMLGTICFALVVRLRMDAIARRAD